MLMKLLFVAYIDKNSLPKLLGVLGVTAVEIIERENSLVTAIIVPLGSSIIPDFRCDSVWVYVDDIEISITVPHIG